MNLLSIEAHAIKSTDIMKDSDHVYLKEKFDPERVWANHGRDSGGRFLLRAELYKEWIMKFVPPGRWCDECGITFYSNGVCQNYANRELLLARNPTDVREANKNEVVLLFFGKYGFGLEALRDRLRKSHRLAGASADILEQVLLRVEPENYVDDELHAWKEILREVTALPIDSILDQKYVRAEARKMQKELIEEKESIFDREEDRATLHNEIIKAVKSTFRRALERLAEFGHIQKEKVAEYQEQFDVFLSQFHKGLTAQAEHFEATGEINPRFADVVEVTA